jgi:Na+/H+ antiporter NhaD/arsenite permease-like protein
MSEMICVSDIGVRTTTNKPACTSTCRLAIFVIRNRKQTQKSREKLEEERIVNRQLMHTTSVFLFIVVCVFDLSQAFFHVNKLLK